MKKYLWYSLVAAGVATVGAAFAGAGEVSAADVTITDAAQIAGAVTQSGEGDTITFSPGTYVITDTIDLSSKVGVTLTGGGSNTIIQYDNAAGQAIRAGRASNIVIQNLTIENVDESSTTSTGIAATASCGVRLNNLAIKDFGRTAVTVTKTDGADPFECPDGGNTITFNQLTMTGNNYGILFTNSPDAVASELDGIVFQGLNTISGGDYGIVMDDIESLTGVSGTDGARLSLGTVDITTNAINGVYYPIRIGESGGTIAMNSRINGKLVSSMNYKDFCALVGAYIIPDGVCIDEDGDGVLDPQMDGFNCACDPNDPNNPDVPCLAPPEPVCPPDEPCIEICPDGSLPNEDGTCGQTCDPNDPADPNYPCVPVPCNPDDPTDPNYPCVPVDECDPTDPTDPDYPCVPGTGPGAPETGFGEMVEGAKSGAVWVIRLGAGTVVGIVLLVGRVKRYHRIKL